MSKLNPRSWSLAIKLSLTFTALMAAVGFMIGTVMVVHDWIRARDTLGEKALLLSRSVAIAAPKAILRNDFWALYLSLKNMHSDMQDIMTAMILDANGNILAHLNPATNPIGLLFSPDDDKEKLLNDLAIAAREPLVIRRGGFDLDGFQEGVVPIFSDQKYLGVVRVRLSVARLYEKAMTSAMIVLGLVFCFVILGSLLGTLLSRRMVKPLAAVTRGLEAAGRSEMAEFAPVSIKSNDEIGRLSLTYNQIMVELAEKRILEREMAMSEKLVALGRITAGVAHEVNNPLAGLMNCVDTLRKHPDDKQLIDRYLPVIDQGLHRIKDIVHNLLVGLKIEERDEIVNVDHIDKLRDLIQAEIGDREIEIHWDNEIQENIGVSAKLEQIIYNLLKNATEVLTQGGEIRFRMYHKCNYLTIEIRDNGPGIPATIRSQLFDPFFTTKTNGTGLGLWVVYRLTQSLEGVIEVESENEQGTIFNISVPVVDLKAA